MSGGPSRPDAERDARAGEYVLGTLAPDERAAFERERAADPAAAAAAGAWERRLAPLLLSAAEVPPPPRVREALLRAVPGTAPRPDPAADERVVALTRQVRRWRLATGGAGLLAAGLAAFALLGPRIAPPEPPARYLAVVQGGGALPALLVTVDLGAGTAQVRPVGAQVPEGKSLELWYISPGDAPRTLGLVGGPTRVSLPAGASPEATLAVTLEPPGGAPGGKATGPVVYSGTLIRE